MRWIQEALSDCRSNSWKGLVRTNHWICSFPCSSLTSFDSQKFPLATSGTSQTLIAARPTAHSPVAEQSRYVNNDQRLGKCLKPIFRSILENTDWDTVWPVCFVRIFNSEIKHRHLTSETTYLNMLGYKTWTKLAARTRKLSKETDLFWNITCFLFCFFLIKKTKQGVSWLVNQNWVNFCTKKWPLER